MGNLEVPAGALQMSSASARRVTKRLLARGNPVQSLSHMRPKMVAGAAVLGYFKRAKAVRKTPPLQPLHDSCVKFLPCLIHRPSQIPNQSVNYVVCLRFQRNEERGNQSHEHSHRTEYSDHQSNFFRATGTSFRRIRNRSRSSTDSARTFVKLSKRTLISEWAGNIGF
jgi:hypothetical protein